MPWVSKLKKHPCDINMKYGHPSKDAFTVGDYYQVKVAENTGEVRVLSEVWYYFLKTECHQLFDKPIWENE